jgi:hypothetical protein
MDFIGFQNPRSVTEAENIVHQLLSGLEYKRFCAMLKEKLQKAIDIVRHQCSETDVAIALDQIFNEGRVRSIITTLDEDSLTYLESRSIMFTVKAIEGKRF